MSLMISLAPDEVEQYLNRAGCVCRFSAAERVRWSTTPIVDTPGRALAFPTPSDNSDLTLSNLKRVFGTDPRHPPSFFDHPWLENEAFTNVRTPAGWHVLLMDVLPESLSQPADYTRSVPSFTLPLAVEVVLMLFLYYMKTGEQLLFKKHTWCADQASLGRQVTVGAFGRNGVFISGHPSNYTSRGLGICPRIG